MNTTTTNKPVTVHVTYRPKKGKEEELFTLVKKHWPALSKAGLATKDPATIYRARSRAGQTYFIEIMSWRDGQAAGKAHQTPEVMAIWEPMGALIDGGPSPEIAEVERVGG